MDFRPSKDDYFMTHAWAAARRTTCVRKGVGCVLVNGLGHIVGTGRNGRPSGYEHCNDREMVKCESEGSMEDLLKNYRDLGLKTERYSTTGSGFDFGFWLYPYSCKAALEPPGAKPIGCEAVHAEQNALLQCYDKLWIDTCYVTRSPCSNICVKELLNTSCRRIVFAEPSSDVDIARELWLRNNSRIDKLPSLIRKTRVWDHFPLPNPFIK